MATTMEVATCDDLEGCGLCAETVNDEAVMFFKCVECDYIHSRCSECADDSSLMFACSALTSNGASCCSTIEPLEKSFAQKEIQRRKLLAVKISAEPMSFDSQAKPFGLDDEILRAMFDSFLLERTAHSEETHRSCKRGFHIQSHDLRELKNCLLPLDKNKLKGFIRYSHHTISSGDSGDLFYAKLADDFLGKLHYQQNQQLETEQQKTTGYADYESPDESDYMVPTQVPCGFQLSSSCSSVMQGRESDCAGGSKSSSSTEGSFQIRRNVHAKAAMKRLHEQQQRRAPSPNEHIQYQ